MSREVISRSATGAALRAAAAVTIEPDPAGAVPFDPRRQPTIVVIAEGYEPGDPAFGEDWEALRDELLEFDPFSQFEAEPERLAVYRCSWDEESPVGSRFDGRSLTVPSDRVRAALEELRDAAEDSEEELSSLVGDLLLAPDPGFATALTPLLVVILVKPTGNARGDTEHRVRDDCPYFVATHPSPDAAAVVAKALGRVFGLGDEGTDPDHLALTDARIGHPNVAFLLDDEATAEGTAHDDYPWRELLTLAEAQQPDEDTPGLHRGGLGRVENSYRFAPHCLMRMPIGGDPQAREPDDRVSFCPVCSLHLEAMITTPVASPPRQRTLDRQTLTYDDAQFTTREDVSRRDGQEFPPAPPAPAGWWEYTVDAAAPGLRLAGVRAHVPGMHGHDAVVQPVAAAIEFRNLSVQRAQDAAPVPIDLGDALNETLERGTDPAGDPLMQEGIKYGAVVPVGDCLVSVELAIAFRGPRDDFDPPGAIDAMKLYPQIAFRQVKKADVPSAPASDFEGVVEAFHGELWFDVDVTTPQAITDHMRMLMPVTYGQVPAGPRNHAGFFTDAADGMLFQLDLARSLEMPDQLASWLSIFDYITPDLTGAREIVAVPGLGEPRSAPGRRKDHYDWPPTGPVRAQRSIWKEPRQGDFDNAHIHGSMGTTYHRVQSRDMGTPRIMAPGCGHSCFHFHWRWGVSAYYSAVLAPTGALLSTATDFLVFKILDAIALAFGEFDRDAVGEAVNDVVIAFTQSVPGMRSPMRADIKGWSADPSGLVRACVAPGAPMVPPNQRIVVRLGDPDEPEAETLPTDRKLVVYAADVDTIWEYDPFCRQVVLEQGVGLAIAYHPDSANARLFRLPLFLETGDLRYLPKSLLLALASGVGTLGGVVGALVGFLAALALETYDDQRVGTEIYDVFRYIDRDQFPMPEAVVRGDWPTAGGTTMEEL